MLHQYVYLDQYVYLFWQSFPPVRLFGPVRLLGTLEYLPWILKSLFQLEIDGAVVRQNLYALAMKKGSLRSLPSLVAKQ